MEKQKYKYMVATRCMTYNHAPYIEEALQGFAKQKTSFPIVTVIVDDASTDEEPEILRKWADDNLNIKDNASLWREMPYGHLAEGTLKGLENNTFVILLLSNNLTQKGLGWKKMEYIAEWNDNAKYIALCEGDDYWIDPLKLQKQVDFMEDHPNHSLCFCAHQRLLSSGETIDVKRYKQNLVTCPMKDIILGGGGFMATNSMLYRDNMYEPYTVWAKDCPIGDLPMMLTLANKGCVGFLVDVMCVYRIMSQGSWSQRTSLSFKKKHQHYLAIVKMWKQFDEYSNYKYHHDVIKKMQYNSKQHVKQSLKMIPSYLKRWFSSKN